MEGKRSTTTRKTTKSDSNPKRPKLGTSVASQQRPLPWYTSFTNSDPAYDQYMKAEWGFEKKGDVALFEKLSLEGAQAGLSWRTILTKREAYRKTFHGFDIDKVARMTSSDVDRILSVDGSGADIVVRHRGKIESVINNAQCIKDMRENELKESEMTFGDFFWSFVDDKPILNEWKSLAEMPSKTPESEAMSKALRKRGFKFVGPTTCYSLMQSCGFVIDHVMGTEEWLAARDRLNERPGGYQAR